MLCSSSYTWTDLTQGQYQFSVVAYTSKGSGETASLMIFILNNGTLIIIIIVKNQDLRVNIFDTYINNFRGCVGA